MKKVIAILSVTASLTLADTSGAGATMVENPSENILVGGASVKIKHIKLPIKKIPDKILQKSLEEKLSTMKNKDLIEVELFLNNTITEENYAGFSSGAFYSRKNKIEKFAVETSDNSIATFLKNYTPTDQKQIVEDKLSEIRKKILDQRIELSEKKLDKILSKLERKSIKDIVKFDKSAGILNIILSKSEILKLSRYPEYFLSISLPTKLKPLLASAFTETRLNTTAYPVSNYGGQGVGIYMKEKNGCFEQSKVEPIENLIGLGGGAYTEDQSEAPHATMVAQCLRMASPQSHIYCSDDIYSVPSSWENNIHIVNYSFSVTGQNEDGIWHSSDAHADRHGYYDEMQLFIAAGNDCSGGGCNVDSPAKSHNAITVGAYNDVTDKIYDSSDWKNPQTGATKPEILAPGEYVQQAGGEQLLYSGTSFAAPIAAGIAASNISLLPDMKKHQALIKATTIAMATKDNITANGNSQPNGASAVQWNPYGWYYWWDYPNDYLDPADGNWMLLKELYLYGGNKIKTIFSWSNREDICDGDADGSSYSGPSNHLCMNLNFKVLDPYGNIKIYSTKTNDNWEGGEFTANYSGNYKFYVSRNYNAYEWTQDWPWSSKVYHYNRAKMGLRVAYVSNE